MYIITQDLVNVAQKILKNSFFTAFNLTVKPIIETLFYCYNELKFNLAMISLKKSLNNLVIKIFEIAIPKIDEYFLKSKYRKQHFYKSNTHDRDISMLFGDLKFKRNYFTDKNKKNGFYLIDKLFNFEKYVTYDANVRGVLIDNTVKTNANLTSNNTSFILGNYEDYLNQDKFINIPRQTIYNWIKKWNIPKIKYKNIDNVKDLYVMVDEKWIHEQIRLLLLNEEEKNKKHYIMSKCFITFTDNEIKNNRSKLINRHVHLTTSNKPWKDFMNSIYEIYNFEEIENIYLLSDAGTWILAGKSELKLFSNNKITVNTCEFHVKEYINRLTRSKKKRKELYEIIYEYEDKKTFIKLADEIIKNAHNKKSKTQLKNYILKHWKTILNMKDRKIKSSMESHISHCVANTFGSRPKGYSRKRIEKYIKLEEAKQNGINILDLYLNSYNKKEKDFTYNQENISFSIFEKTKGVLPNVYSKSPISILLHNVAYN